MVSNRDGVAVEQARGEEYPHPHPSPLTPHPSLLTLTLNPHPTEIYYDRNYDLTSPLTPTLGRPHLSPSPLALALTLNLTFTFLDHVRAGP